MPKPNELERAAAALERLAAAMERRAQADEDRERTVDQLLELLRPVLAERFPDLLQPPEGPLDAVRDLRL